MTPDELVVVVEALREYRLRAPITRRAIIDPLVIRLMAQLTKKEGDADN